LGTLRARFLEEASSCRQAQQVRVIVSVLADLRTHGWGLAVSRGRIKISRLERATTDGEKVKVQVRAGHAMEREAQLRKASVRKFVRGMEEARLGPTGWVSIFSLMRDGRGLAEGLRRLAEAPSASDAQQAMREVIDPYVEIVNGAEECQHTGLRLMDVWRYFRYTWATAYQPVPGRSMMILVRDGAVPNHPVIGIAALTSPVVQLRARDRWIGWAPGQLSECIEPSPTAAWAKWMRSALEGLIAGIYVSDLVRDGLVSRREFSRPTDKCIRRLQEEARRARAAHQRYPTKRVHKNPKSDGSAADWRRRSETHLFRSKRADALAQLLWVRKTFGELGDRKKGRAWLADVLASPEGRRAVERIRRHVKAIHVGNDLSEISICGAIPPYNTVLGGKLVAMLLTSPEVAKAYRAKYSDACSIIASSMAGRAVKRKPQLVAMATTSLYGMKLSQYTRISIPGAECGIDGSGTVAYRELGMTEGQGSYHLSGQTIDEIELLLSQTENGRRVNSIFGEGVNPRMRKIRTGLDMCGFPSDHVLMHGNPRVVYGVALAANFREILLGQAKRPRYLLPMAAPQAVTQAIGDFWFRRWLQPRLTRDGLLEGIARDSLARPITHRARVVLPDVPGEEPLFDQQSDGDP